MADVKFDITEIGRSSIWDEGEIWSLQGGSATGLTDVFSMGGLSVFRRYLPGFASCKGCLSLQFLSFQLLNLCLTETGMGMVLFFFKKKLINLFCMKAKPNDKS